MPTVLRVDGFRFFFYTEEGDEPPHIHVRKGANECKYWLEPVQLARNYGFKPKELSKIQAIIWEYQQFLVEKYNEYHKRN